MDPLSRGESGPKAPSFYKGFYDAQKRRPVKNIEPTAGQAVGGAVLTALPLAALYYFVVRRRVGVASTAGGKNTGFFSGVREAVERQLSPMGIKNFRVDVTGTKFKDVIGVPEAVQEVQQYVQFLKTPERFTRLGGRLPKGCILTGQPGTGKTLLAKAVAGEAGVPFFACSGADFIEVYAGSGPKRVRELFTAAKSEAPSVVFLDEIDAVGSRGSGQDARGVAAEENRTVNQLLAELDGLAANEAVVVFAATNFLENIDKALLREGRFDRKVEVPMPDRQAREDIFAHYLRRIVTSDVESKAHRLAGLTPGVPPATISTIVNEAALAAAMKGEVEVGESFLLPAVDDVLIGKKHRNRMSKEALRRVALHEGGHALVAWLIPQQSDVIKVSITSRGTAAGFTQQLGREVLDMPTDLSLFTDLCVMLAGRLAESTQYTELTNGAQDDYQRATQTAIREFLAFGMSHRVGLLAFEPQRLHEGRVFQRHSERAQAIAEKEAARLIEAAQRYTMGIILQHKNTLCRLTEALLEKQELLFEDLLALLGKRGSVSLTQDAEQALADFVVRSEVSIGTLSSAASC
ncbi:putative ATPase family protein [Trypanosoma vivax]|uniref:ATP-dependent zinc metallopeptidase, putative n=1 Tax=Trypanosoma vivax (strain Y486) TaxID=1055687 RepID=F9WQY4_TRYVY|nr:putative ATP-dependent zinc metallopeptidase [Trypanosoma vivax]KAH8611028.1 putative ATPase family protein [Trypanosoma vivax]KAH8619955.1 putative ATPase family protein [Trypanosoma vivax]CCD19966.1 ATP-dependent zinc metallopeptidase, putative [Trypanosoma vivax Y486]|eukprot:CCD19966.1 ATP-dependent zinc metallopeptidase, putative [Trypanosoma vivax Y486]